MIGYLEGIVKEIWKKEVLLGLGGVGYRVVVGESQTGNFTIGERVELYVHTYVKEDELSLYGFNSRKGLATFEMLIGVSGVGPKMALGILGHGSVEAIHKAVAMADVGFFTKVKGIGKKNGQRIIVDLKSKMGDLQDLEFDSSEVIEDDLVQGLVGMGYEQRKVLQVLQAIDSDLDEGVRLKMALRKLSAS